MWGCLVREGCAPTQTLTAAQRRAERKAAALKKAEEEEKRNSDMWASVRKLVKLPSFQVPPPANYAAVTSVCSTANRFGCHLRQQWSWPL